MKTIIDSCGSKWKGDTPNTVAQLLALLAVEPLDPQFEDFGNFINTNPMAARDGGYGPDGKRLYIETGPCYPDMPGCVEFWGNFYAVSHVFKIVSTDPAVIVLVRDPDDRALLGRRADWPETWFSTLAGFVEAGESVEHAVQREVFEESGVRVSPAKLAYRGSQPWPFPNSLMLGFHAWSVDGDEPTPDGAEIVEARWFTRAQIAELGARGAVRIPPQVSIARHLIEDWFGGALDASWSRSSAASSR